MHIQYICELWHQPARRDDPEVGLRVDATRAMIANWSQFVASSPLAKRRSPR